MEKDELKTIRVKNLSYLCDVSGKDFVRQQCGYSDDNYFNQLKTGHGSFGPRTAAKIEKAMKKPPGWMSESHPIEWDEIGSVSVEQFKQRYEELAKMGKLLPEEERSIVLDAIAALTKI